ncbi:MAG: helix-turn-helix transcriptional regulator [Candidatus Gastranaerophilales bacterium]|nr:helix-turn-helix transcriptional regulator [Candidatus Gastranaerophilales bacterium]
MKYNELAKNFGFQIKMMRMKKGVTQAQLAELLNCQENYVSCIETGKVNVTLKTINKIANSLGVKELKFFDFED